MKEFINKFPVIFDTLFKSFDRNKVEVESTITVSVKTDTNESVVQTVIVPGRVLNISLVSIHTNYGVNANKDINLEI